MDRCAVRMKLLLRRRLLELESTFAGSTHMSHTANTVMSQPVSEWVIAHEDCFIIIMQVASI